MCGVREVLPRMQKHGHLGKTGRLHQKPESSLVLQAHKHIPEEGIRTLVPHVKS